MLFPARLPFDGIVVALATGVALGFGSPARAADELLDPVARATSDRSVVWQDFQTRRFKEQTVSPGDSWRLQLAPPPGDLMDLSLHFTAVAAKSDGRFALEIRDDDSHLLATYDAAFLASHASFSTGPLAPGPLTVRVNPDISHWIGASGPRI